MIDTELAVPLRTQVEMLLRKEIDEGNLAVDDRLPSVRQLATSYGVGKTTVASAIAVLAREGLLHARPQRGTRISRRPHGKSPRRALAGRIGVMFTAGLDLAHDPYYSAILAGFQSSAAHIRRTLALLWDDGDTRQADVLKHDIDGRGLDGVVYVVVDKPHPQTIRRLLRARMPVVMVDCLVPDLDADTILIDNLEGMRKVVRHLTDLGHRRIAYLGAPTPRRSGTSRSERFEGYRAGLADAGIAFEEALVERGGLNVGDGQRDMRGLLENGPTAAAAFCDYQAMGAILAAEEAGLNVPRDISIAGFGNQSATLGLERPLTTVSIDTLDMARSAIEALVGRLDGTPAPGKVTRTKADLMIQSTTAKCRKSLDDRILEPNKEK